VLIGMFERRTFKYLAAIVASYVALILPGAIWSSYLDSPAGYLLLVPYFSIAVFHKLGVPGLLEHDGLCGWGWCSPTVFGWIFAVALWLLLAWLCAWMLATLSWRLRGRGRPG
jgi:hypothetical protein